MIKNKIVVKYQNGEIVKGWTGDFRPNREVFHLYPLKEYEYGEGEVLEVKLSSLKAVFFVKDYKGNKNYKKVRTFKGQSKVTPTQRKIVVTFKDGENVYGTSHSYGPNREGFFVYPIDTEDNNERIFVVQSAIESIRLMKFDSEIPQTYRKKASEGQYKVEGSKWSSEVNSKTKNKNE